MMVTSVMDTMETLLLAVAILLIIGYLLDRRRTVKIGITRTVVANKAPPIIAKAVQEEPALDGPPITILFASQTGIGEFFAETFFKEAKARHFNPTVYDIEQYDYVRNFANEKLVVLFVSTHGEGDPPDSMTEFHAWLMSSERDKCLTGVNYALFGLGNRQYEHFNKAAITTDNRLSFLGANRIMEVTLGDDSGCIEEDNENWKCRVWPAINQFLGISMADVGSALIVYEPSFRIIYSAELPAPEVSFRNRRSSSAALSTHRIVDLIENRELLKRPTEMLSTFHIALSTANRELPYGTAHNVGIHPRNDYKVVAKMCKCLGVDPEQIFTLKRLKFGTSKRFPVPNPCSVRDALLWHVDLMSPPRKAFLGFMAQYAADPDEKLRLGNMSLLIGKDDYHEHIAVDKKTVLELFEMFPSVHPPFEHFLEECAPLQPRMFTIASSALQHPDQIHLTVALSRTVKSAGRIHDGVCSTYMKTLRPGKDMLNIFIRKSLFNLPEKRSTPVIMVATGTGIAPFRAFIQEGMWHYREAKGDDKPKLPEWHLFFGCRYADDDFLYADEIRAAQEAGVVTGVHLALSRQDPTTKVYVQDVLEKSGDLLWDLIDNKNASMFICGSVNMGKSVRDVLRAAIAKGCGEAKAGDYVTKLANDGRLISELWG